ncbi:hypothetical protein JVU11DRAFT_7488 [Chiua virens]|nr:hypothetical protein JVU11DRAFT_7488 [Chiua virens]
MDISPQTIGTSAAHPASNQPISKRDALKNIADTTLQAIKAGSITFPNGSLDLAAKIRFSNHNTRYYPPEDHSLSRWSSDAPLSPQPRPRYRSWKSRHLMALASYMTCSTRPGGGFLNGAQAQEESIARSSTLFPSLMTDAAEQFYKLHLRDRQGGFYSHAMIYTPSIVILRNDSGDWVTPFEVDVLTSAAVNAGDVRNKKGGPTDQAKVENMIESTMKERMSRILSLMEQQGAKNLVLGSFGTGAFRNNVEVVARIWEDLLMSKNARYRSSFDRIVFAILGSTTFTTFKKTFEKSY